jgi:hypothetical protein
MTYTTQTNKRLDQVVIKAPYQEAQNKPIPPLFFGQMFQRVKITNPKCMSCQGAVSPL